MWDVATGQRVATSMTRTARGGQGLGAVAVSPDGGLLAAVDSNGGVYILLTRQLVS